MPNLKIGPDDFTGGSGTDEYLAKVKVSGGNRLNTLETGDRIDGRGNFDTLDAELSDEGGSYLVRPTLISVEKARFSVVTPDDEDDKDGSDGVTVNLNRSEDLKVIVNYQSLGDLTLNNVDDVQKFYWKNGESGDFAVNDLTADYYSFEITNTGESETAYHNLYIDGDDAKRSSFILEDAFVRIAADNAVDYARLTVSNSQIDLELDADKISFDSIDTVNGASAYNFVHFDDSGADFTRFVVTGDSFIELNPGSTGITVNKVFDASGNAGGIGVDGDIFGSFKRFSASTGDDYVQNITSSRDGDVRIGFRGGNLGAGVLTADNATNFYIDTSSAFGESTFIDAIVSNSTADGATVNVTGGDGGDEIGGIVVDLTSPIPRLLLVAPVGEGLAISGTATANVDMGAGQDVLRITNLYDGAANSIDMGNGRDALDIADAGGLNLNDEGGAAPVSTLDGGAGNDTLVAEFTSGFASGDGEDTVANTIGRIVNFETLVLAQQSGGTFDMDALPDVATVQLGQGGFYGTFDSQPYSDQDGGTYEFLNIGAGTTFIVSEGFATLSVRDGEGNPGAGEGGVEVNPSLTPVELTLRADAGVTSTTVQMGEVFNSEIPIGTTYFADVDVDGFTTLDVISNGPHLTDSETGQDTFNAIGVTDITGDTAVDILTTINISGVENIGVGIYGEAVETVDAGSLSGDLDLTSSQFTRSVEIIGGSGDDLLVGSGDGDTFDLSQGGRDVVVFGTANDSDLAIGQSDGVIGFDGGASLDSGDKFVFDAQAFGDGNADKATVIHGATLTRAYTLAEANAAPGVADDHLVFLGNADTFAQAQASVLTNDVGANNMQGHDYIGAVYDGSTDTLYIDTDSDGDLDADDFALQLDAGVASINARDLLTLDFSQFSDDMP